VVFRAWQEGKAIAAELAEVGAWLMLQFGTKVLAAEACSAAMMQTYWNALILCL
jgi:hypothetical protein